ncbi:ankyrin repeat-containing domain protein [Phialemonium atrogriseum]|uniref:Ankyrin repeat-containing domain protein n=1 Tax=Phialemonium atrogriseum TaxID=1093897 RepID=A0AAJ0BVP3_9PEZI|nr:ankyrin repeat-containing domain protein [Phialemonium atrogriseum]KAK1765324.1 ankyrin repeat-containing domain protein [Phialemonium atrogriseum]
MTYTFPVTRRLGLDQVHHSARPLYRLSGPSGSASVMLKQPAVVRLDASPYRDRKDRNPDRVPGTCGWFVSHELFREWQASKSSRMLWVSADPGCGKSVLAKHLVDSILPTTESRTTCYFFFKDDFEDQRSVVSAIRCILRQLFIQRRILLSDKILDHFEVGGETLSSSFGELWDTLINAAEDQNAGEIVCLLDAVDECEEQGRSQLAKALCKLYGSRRNFNLKFLLTSRPYAGISLGFRPLEIPGLPVIHLSGEDDVEMAKISREIDAFIKARVHDIGVRRRLTLDEQELLLQKLMRVSNRTYLWVHLTLDLIESDIDIDKTGIVEATSHLPKTVEEAYDRILSKSRDTEKAKKILHIITHRSYGDLDLKPEDRFRDSVRDICGLFVTIIDSRIYLLHQTAKEFLVHDKEYSPKAAHTHLKWKHSLLPRESHRILAKICIWHLLLVEFETHPLDENGLLSEYLEDHIFLDYSARHWASHILGSEIETQDALAQSIRRLCDVSSSRCLTWFRVYWASTNTEFPDGFTTLMIASYFGLRTVVKSLLETDGSDLDTRDDKYERSALSWAAGNGFDAVVKLLVKGAAISLKGLKLPFRKRAKVDLEDRDGRTPLSYAVWNGNVAVVKLLLRAGAGANREDQIGGTPLSYAICGGDEEVIKQLLKKGTQVGVRSEDSISKELLLSAAKMGHRGVVELLLEKGADTEARDESGKTPLQWAAENSQEGIVRLLLEKGANTEARDISGMTLLQGAAWRGYKGIVRLLLEKKADTEARDVFGQTPLGLAAKEGYEDIVRLLLDKGADTEARDESGKTLLQWAAENSQEGIVRLLLEKGANTEARDVFGQTLLQWAAWRGYKDIVRLLLEKGADTEAMDISGKRLLCWAAKNGQEGIVRLLLEKGADTKAMDESGRTLLRWAAENGQEGIVRLLLEKGADRENVLE